MRRVVVALCWLAAGSVWADAPKVATDAKQNTVVTADTYEFTVDPGGNARTIRVGQQDFLDPSGAAAGGYFYQDGIVPLGAPTRPEPGTIAAQSDRAAIKYACEPQRMTWTLTNRTGKRMLYVFIMHPGLEAVQVDRALWFKPPVEQSAKASTWFGGGAKLDINGSTRLWGPFNGKYPIWEVALEAKETRQVVFTAGPASDAEKAQATKVATTKVEPPKDPVGPMWDLPALSKVPATLPAPGFEGEGVKALFYEGVPFQGRPTRVFAWIGLPKVEPGQKVPAMVLVHGGGGTAFDSWVRRWTARGYAAIAMDTCGCVPRGKYGAWERHEHGGPSGWGGWGQIDWPREDQWTYHAVAAAVLGHSLLRSLPEVDAERTGVTGISWGGYLCSIIAGVDSRFKLAEPVYGCGYTLDMAFGGSVRSLAAERADRWMRWWDPSVYLKNARMPMLWVTGTNDFAYWFPGLQKSYRATKGPHALCVTIRMPHGHGDAGEGPKELFAFADAVLKGGQPMARVTGQRRDGLQVSATFEGGTVAKAELCYTTDRGDWTKRKWQAAPATLAAGRVTAQLPEETTVYYFNLIDAGGLVVSTDHEELP